MNDQKGNMETIRDVLYNLYDREAISQCVQQCRDNAQMNKLLAEMWTGDSIAFYDDNLLYSSQLFHKLPLDSEATVKNIANHVSSENYVYQIAKLFRNQHHRVLDYGCGVGHYGFAFAHFGYNVTFADIPSPHFELVKVLCEKMKVGEIVDLTQKQPVGEYDIISCVQVLEHVKEPVEKMKMFHRLLSEHGLLILEVFFTDGGGCFPYHLHENNIYGSAEYRRRLWREIGFMPIYMHGSEWRVLAKCN